MTFIIDYFSKKIKGDTGAFWGYYAYLHEGRHEYVTKDGKIADNCLNGWWQDDLAALIVTINKNWKNATLRFNEFSIEHLEKG